MNWNEHNYLGYISDANRATQLLQSEAPDPAFVSFSLNLLDNYLTNRPNLVESPVRVDTKRSDEALVGLAIRLYTHINAIGYWSHISSAWPHVVALASGISNQALWVEVATQLAITLNDCGHANHASHLYDQIITSGGFESLSHALRAEAYHQAAICHLRQGEYHLAERYLQRCIETATGDGLLKVRAYAFNQLGNLALSRGKFAAAEANYNQSLAIFNVMGEGNGRACIAYKSLGNLYMRQGKVEQAQPLLEQSYKIRLTRPEEAGTANTAIYLAQSYIASGELGVAEQLLHEALLTCHRLQDVRGIIRAHIAFGKLEEKRGNIAAAYQEWRRALETLQTIQAPSMALEVLALLLSLALRTKDVKGIVMWSTQILKVLREDIRDPSSIWRLLSQHMKGQSGGRGGKPKLSLSTVRQALCRPSRSR